MINVLASQSQIRRRVMVRHRCRGGVAMVMVVLTLVVVTALLGGLLRHLVLANRQTKQFANKALTPSLSSPIRYK